MQYFFEGLEEIPEVVECQMAHVSNPEDAVPKFALPFVDDKTPFFELVVQMSVRDSFGEQQRSE